MKMRKLFYRVLAVMILVAMLLFQNAVNRVPSGQAGVPNAGWQEVGIGSATGGGISDNNGATSGNAIAVTSNNIPYIAWADASSGWQIYIRRWNGITWEEVGVGSATGGGISNSSGTSRIPSLAIGPDDIPYVAWRDDNEIYVRRWNGNSWEEVGTGSASGGGISNNSGTSDFPAIALTSSGIPYVAWQDNSSGDSEIYVRRWNGSSWAEVGPGSASGGGISNNGGYSKDPSIAIASDGKPYIAWHDFSSGNLEIYVRRWNSSSWAEVGPSSATGGGISNDSGGSGGSSIAIAPDGTPYVAWNDDSSGNSEIYVRRWVE